MSALKKVPEIQEIIGTTGDSDIVARISADPRENLLESVVTKVQGMPGVLSTETLPAFSKYMPWSLIGSTVRGEPRSTILVISARGALSFEHLLELQWDRSAAA